MIVIMTSEMPSPALPVPARREASMQLGEVKGSLPNLVILCGQAARSFDASIRWAAMSKALAGLWEGSLGIAVEVPRIVIGSRRWVILLGSESLPEANGSF